MANNQSNRNIIRTSGTFFQELTNRFRLISRLLMDSRVHPLVKLLPIGSLAYVVWPIDIPGPIDDAMILWLGTTLFVELCPPNVVEEHQKALKQRVGSGTPQNVSSPTQESDVIDGEFFETDPNKQTQNSSR